MASSGAGSRRKGARAEIEIARILPGANRIARAGYEGHDLEWCGRGVEVKRRANGFAQLYRWLNTPDVRVLAMRADRAPWLLVLEAGELLELAEEVGAGRWRELTGRSTTEGD